MIYIIIILILVVVVLLLTIGIFHVIKRATYLSKKEKEMIEFVIDLYLDYGEEINIIDEENHEMISKKLEELKEKLDGS